MPHPKEIIETVRVAIQRADNSTGMIDLRNGRFEGLPVSSREFFAICRKHAGEWGYRYQKQEYVESGQRVFSKGPKRGYLSGPYLIRE